MNELAGNVVAITGAARGIGRAIALDAARKGARVIVADLGGSAEDGSGASKAPAELVAAEIRALGGEALACTSDISTMSGGRDVIDAALNAFDRLDGLVCCAGLLTQRHLWEMSEREWDDVIASHLKGHFSCTQAASKTMMRQRSGSIVHVSSAAALVTPPHQPSYSAAKAGVLGFSRSCALDLEAYGVRVNCIMPGAATRMTDAVYAYYGVQDDGNVKAGKAGAELAPGVGLRSDQAGGTWRDPARVAPFVAFLLSDRSSGVTGQTFAVVGDQVTHVLERSYGKTMHVSSPSDIDSLARQFAQELAPSLEMRQFQWPPA